MKWKAFGMAPIEAETVEEAAMAFAKRLATKYHGRRGFVVDLQKMEGAGGVDGKGFEAVVAIRPQKGQIQGEVKRMSLEVYPYVEGVEKRNFHPNTGRNTIQVRAVN